MEQGRKEDFHLLFSFLIFLLCACATLTKINKFFKIWSTKVCMYISKNVHNAVYTYKYTPRIQDVLVKTHSFLTM